MEDKNTGKMENGLSLTEKLLLLAIRPEKGGLSGWNIQEIDFTLVGAVLLELTLSRNVVIRDKRVEVIHDKSNSVLHSYVLERLSRSPRPRKIGHWMEPFSISKRRVRSALYESLVQKREIRLEDRKFLFFKWKKPFLGAGNHVYNLIDKIKSHIVQTPDNPEDLFLLALLEPAELWKRIYPERSMRKSARMKIKQFMEKNQSSETVRQALETIKVIKAALAARRAAAAAS
jgi:hypothetical protein